MKFILFATALAAIFLPAVLADTTTASYDTIYDDANASLDIVACSNGANGLEPGYTTIGSLPGFPNVGGASAIAGWDSPNCGTCWQLTYTDAQGNATTITMLGIDHSADGFVLSEETMNTLTGGLAVQLGRVTVESQQVDSSVCGL